MATGIAYLESIIATINIIYTFLYKRLLTKQGKHTFNKIHMYLQIL